MQGRVTDRQGQGIPNLRIEAWDNDLILHDLVGSAITDEQGAFQMQFEESYFRELFLDRQPGLFFRVFRENILIKSTEKSVMWNVETAKTPVVIEVDLAAAEETPKEFVVQGQVRHPDGNTIFHKLRCINGLNSINDIGIACQRGELLRGVLANQLRDMVAQRPET
jgi:hypothetical protein